MGRGGLVSWVVARFRGQGDQAGGPDGGWTQAVPLVRTQVLPGIVEGGGEALAQGQGVYVSTVRPIDRVAIADAPMVVVGHGVSTPERGWARVRGG